ncbi:myosin heavy chain IB-like isoform X1 [Pristis pectinata]|uniref:myosin heavy chain IB-like isoform X1 n=1 Tax=Pristis pectinata TaxID=685728 RepID=UPI00223CC3F3|nr:myosin heavy chain IB-like isoform X1 [Pristis pectinata]
MCGGWGRCSVPARPVCTFCFTSLLGPGWGGAGGRPGVQAADWDRGGAGGGPGVQAADWDRGGAGGGPGVQAADWDRGGAGGGPGVQAADWDRGGAGGGPGVQVADRDPGVQTVDRDRAAAPPCKSAPGLRHLWGDQNCTQHSKCGRTNVLYSCNMTS